jgi:hypothetical protein
LHTARQSITDAVQALADTGQIKVWLLREHVVDDPELHLSGIYASLSGAIHGAQLLICDELIPYNEDQPFGQDPSRMNYVIYMVNDIAWEFDYPEEIRRNIGLYNFTTTDPNKNQRKWQLDWHELMP